MPATEVRQSRAAAGTGAGARLGIQWLVSYGRPTYRVQATCVLDPVHCERPDGRRDNSSAPDYGAMPRGPHSSPADHRSEEKKIFCRVTTRVINFVAVNVLERGFGSLTALFLCLGVACSSCVVLAMQSLTPRGLPTTDLPLTVWVMTVTLVPTRRQILTITPLAQASPQPRSTRSRRAPASYFNVRGAHGSCNSQGKARGECHAFSSGAIQHAPEALTRRSPHFPEQDSELNDFKYALRTRRPSAAAHLIENAADSEIGPRSGLHPVRSLR